MGPSNATVVCRRGYAETLHMASGLRMIALPRGLGPSKLLTFIEDRADYAILMRGRQRCDQLVWMVQRGHSASLRIAFWIEAGQDRVYVIHNLSRGGDRLGGATYPQRLRP